MPTRHTVRTTQTVEVTYTCDMCGYSARGLIDGEGTGGASSYVFFDRDRAREKAADEAIAEAQHDARMTASIAPCPRCNVRSRRAVASFVTRGVVEVIVWAGLALGVWWLLDSWGRWISLAVGAAVVAGTIKRRRTRYALAGAMLHHLRTNVVLPRAEVRSLPGAPARTVPAGPPAKAPTRIEPTPPSSEPRNLR